MAKGKRSRDAVARRSNVIGRDLLEAIEKLEAADELVAIRVKALADAKKARTDLRTATASSGWNMAALDLLMKERNATPDQLRLNLEREENFRLEVEVYRAAIAQLPEGTRAADIPVNPSPIEEEISEQLARIAREAGKGPQSPEPPEAPLAPEGAGEGGGEDGEGVGDEVADGFTGGARPQDPGEPCNECGYPPGNGHHWQCSQFKPVDGGKAGGQ